MFPFIPFSSLSLSILPQALGEIQPFDGFQVVFGFHRVCDHARRPVLCPRHVHQGLHPIALAILIFGWGLFFSKFSCVLTLNEEKHGSATGAGPRSWPTPLSRLSLFG